MHRLTPLLALGLVLAAGCSGSSGGAEAKRSAGPPPAPSFGPGLQAATGTSYAVGIPTDPAFTAVPTETKENGARVSHWSFELTPGGASCTIVASEQPSYTGDFPGAALETFTALAESTDHIVANEAVPPPAGAVAAVRQEEQFTAKLKDGSSVPARLFQRQLLTPGKTLVSLSVAGPEDALTRCRASDIMGSLQLTGQELGGASS